MKKIPKVAYTLEFKNEVLRRVRNGEPIRRLGRELGIPEQSIRNWAKAQANGKLDAVGNGKPPTPEQMELSRLRAGHKRRFKATTDSKHSLPVAPNRLEQNFSTEKPDQVWTADITYLATAEGWLYLAMVLDLHTRQIIGWAMRERMTKELVIDA